VRVRSHQPRSLPPRTARWARAAVVSLAVGVLVLVGGVHPAMAHTGGHLPGAHSPSSGWGSRDRAPRPVPAPTPVPAPSVEPAPSAVPALPALPAESLQPTRWPDESSTGVPMGTALTASDGLYITSPGTIVSGLDVVGNVEIRAENVTIEDSRITGKVEVFSAGAVLRRIEIVGPGPSGAGEHAVGWANYSCDACNVHGWGKGFYMEDNVTITNSWVHDLSVIGDPSADGSHNEAIYTQGGSDFTIINNRLDAGDAPNFSSSISLFGQQRAVQNALVQGNLLNGGGYCLYAGYESGIPPVNTRYLNNTFGTDMHADCGQFGPATGYYGGNGNRWAGNVRPNGTEVAAPD